MKKDKLVKLLSQINEALKGHANIEPHVNGDYTHFHLVNVKGGLFDQFTDAMPRLHFYQPSIMLGDCPIFQLGVASTIIETFSEAMEYYITPMKEVERVMTALKEIDADLVE